MLATFKVESLKGRPMESNIKMDLRERMYWIQMAVLTLWHAWGL
jgi:hypothetical protein